MANYRIKKGAVIVAIQEDGDAVGKTATKEKLYHAAEHDDEGGWYVFRVKPGSIYRELRVLDADVVVEPEITAIQDGTYTIVFPPEYGLSLSGYVTIKFHTPKNERNDDGSPNFFCGKQIVSYLSGPDNENNFTGFCHLDEKGGIHLWKRFREQNMEKYMQAVKLLGNSGEIEQEMAGMAYAMKSGRCRKCNRTLTVPASLHRGMGPVCAGGGEDA